MIAALAYHAAAAEAAAATQARKLKMLIVYLDY